MQKNEILCSKQLVEELRAKLQVAAAEKDNAQTQLRAYVEAEAAVSTSFVIARTEQTMYHYRISRAYQKKGKRTVN